MDPNTALLSISAVALVVTAISTAYTAAGSNDGNGPKDPIKPPS